MRAGHQHSEGLLSKRQKELLEVRSLLIGEHREPRQRTALVPVERRRDTPHPTLVAVAELRLFVCRILFQAVGRICDNGMNRVWRLLIQPLKTIGFNENVGGHRTHASSAGRLFLGQRALPEPGLWLNSNGLAVARHVKSVASTSRQRYVMWKTNGAI